MSPATQAGTPRSVSSATVSSATVGGTTASMPTPMLNVRSISSGATPPRSAMRPKIGAGAHDVSSIDALLIINVLNHPPELTPQLQSTATAATPTLYLDTNRDNHVSSIDALLVINAINNGLGGEAEDDQAAAAALDWSDTLAVLAADAAAQVRRRRSSR